MDKSNADTIIETQNMIITELINAFKFLDKDVRELRKEVYDLRCKIGDKEDNDND